MVPLLLAFVYFYFNFIGLLVLILIIVLAYVKVFHQPPFFAFLVYRKTGIIKSCLYFKELLENKILRFQRE
jgi:hypothetical protein